VGEAAGEGAAEGGVFVAEGIGQVGFFRGNAMLIEAGWPAAGTAKDTENE
jgi:hypothetical protein